MITKCLFGLSASPCDHTDVDSMNLDDYNIHVIASVFKQWLRDLPNPLMTFELYEEFIRAMGKWSRSDVKLHCVFKSLICSTLEIRFTITIYYCEQQKMYLFAVTVNGDLSCGNASPGLQDKKETIRGVYSVIDQLSRTHLNTLERLIFHLVR